MILADVLNNFFLGYLPYISVAVFVTGVGYKVYRRNNTIQATSSQFVSNDKNVLWGSTLFHFAIVMVVVGHILGLFTPEWLYTLLVSNETKRLLAMIMGALSGIVALIGITMLVMRRFMNKRVRATSKPQDYIIASLILLQILLGLWGTYITSQSPLETYMAMDHWAQGIAILEPDAWRYVADVDVIYKLHFVNGFLIFMIFPFTKLMHMIMVPINYALDHFR